MAITMLNIPSSVRTPFLYVDFDPSRAGGYSADVQRTLLIGQRLSSGTVAAKTLTRIASATLAGQYFGAGSMLHQMAIAAFANDPNGEFWAVAVDDKSSGTKASWALTVTAAPTANGSIYLYIGGQRLVVDVLSTDDESACATKIAAAVNAATTLAVTAGAASAVVTLTARHKGVVAGAIDIRVNYLGADGGESLPTGYAQTVVKTNGTGDPDDVDDALTAIADDPVEVYALGVADATSITALDAHIAARWGYARMLYGHGVCYVDDTANNLLGVGDNYNAPNITMFGAYKVPTLPWVVAAAAAAQMAASVRVDPALPFQTLPLAGVKPPAHTDRFSLATREALLHGGVAQLDFMLPTTTISRAITTCLRNGAGELDTSMLDSEVMFTNAAIIRRLRSAVRSKWPRHKLVSDGTRIAPGQQAVSPRMIRAALIAEYLVMEGLGLVEDVDTFAAALVVERNVDDRNRVDVMFPPDIANQLRIVAVRYQYAL
jgi:phage tail sheath gpL-like